MSICRKLIIKNLTSAHDDGLFGGGGRTGRARYASRRVARLRRGRRRVRLRLHLRIVIGNFSYFETVSLISIQSKLRIQFLKKSLPWPQDTTPLKRKIEESLTRPIFDKNQPWRRWWAVLRLLLQPVSGARTGRCGARSAASPERHLKHYLGFYIAQ